jgi:hypothetical protein
VTGDATCWAADVAPGGPYDYGTRRLYAPGERLLTDVVSNIEGEEDDRQMCFATTCLEHALHWAYQRGICHGGDTLYVYEVEMSDPEVDVNMHRAGTLEPITSAMSARGRVIRLVRRVPEAEHPDRVFG